MKTSLKKNSKKSRTRTRTKSKSKSKSKVLVLDYTSFKNKIKNIDILSYIYTKKIPPILFKTSSFELDKAPSEIKDILYNPENKNYITVYFSDTDIISFIKEEYPEFYDDYANVRPGAFKADIFRLLVLYLYGGIYNDIGHMFLRPIGQIVSENDELVLTKDWISTSHKAIHNSFMGAYPRHPLILSFIENVMKNVHTHYYGSNPLDITGPTALGLIFNNFFSSDKKNKKNKILTGSHVYKNHDSIDFHVKFYYNDSVNIDDTIGTPVIRLKFPNYYDIMYTNRNVKRYGDMWKDREVYIQQSIKK